VLLHNHFRQYKNILLPNDIIFLRSIREDQEEVQEEKHGREDDQRVLQKVRGLIPYQVQVHLRI